ncbi:MAG: abortive infection family protein [bacterium]|nr:abortive infection family protein [bacterium]
MALTRLTRKDIIDELRLHDIIWYGRLGEVDFLKRIFDLENLPTTDSRCKNMEGDIWKHRIANNDWDDFWVFSDDRLAMEVDEKIFLDFLCETIHPVVRASQSDVNDLLEIYNSHLAQDGWKIVEKNRISGRPVFVAVGTQVDIDLENQEKIKDEVVQGQLSKCEEKFNRDDYDGAISSARSLVESSFADIHSRVTGESIERDGDLLRQYKRINKFLNLSEDRYSNEKIKGLMRGLVVVVSSLDDISNQMGDRHTRPVKPQKHHARFCVNAAKTIMGFLYDTLEYKFAGRENIYNDLTTILDGNIRLLPYESLITHKDIRRIISKTDPYVRTLIKKQLLEKFEVLNYRQSDVFFAALKILNDQISKDDIETIFQVQKKNGQACGLDEYIIWMRSQKPEFISQEMSTYVLKTPIPYVIED